MKMMFLKFSIFCVAFVHASEALGFLESCADDAFSRCLPEAGCVTLNTVIIEDLCGENLKCCLFGPNSIGQRCALDETELGYCSVEANCRTDDNEPESCDGQAVCCPQDDLIATGESCRSTGSCVLSGNCQSDSPFTICETGSTCCVTEDKPGLGDNCGLESSDQGTCFDASMTGCTQTVLNGDLCQDGLSCCTKPEFGFLESCADDPISRCLPEAGCDTLNTAIIEDFCGENLKCCLFGPNSVGNSCALSATEFGYCVLEQNCRTNENVPGSCDGTNVCCPQDDLIATGESCHPTGSCVLSGNCQSDFPFTICETGSTCCLTENKPGTGEDCGLESSDQGTCFDASVTSCNQTVLNGDLCQDGLSCCAKPIPENLGKRCGDCGQSGTCQKQCCGESTIDSDDCGSDELVCCVPGLGMDCRLSDGDLSKCIFKKDCETRMKKRRQTAKIPYAGVDWKGPAPETIPNKVRVKVIPRNKMWNNCRNPNLVCCP